MWEWLSRIRQNLHTSTQQSELLARYKQLRQVGLKQNNRLVEMLSKSDLDEGGRRLGILKNNVFVLDTEDESSVLMDYCIHDVRRQGVNAIDRFLAESPPALGSDERILLEAKQQSRYSLFAVEAVERGTGVHVHDLLRDERLFLVDIGFSTSATPGMVLATRIMAPEGIGMTTGAPLPVGMLSDPDRAKFVQVVLTTLKGADFHHLSLEEASSLTTAVIRSCLQKGAAEHVRYAEPRGGGGRGFVPAAAPTPQRVGRNSPCPCGSGKKFKHCCGARS